MEGVNKIVSLFLGLILVIVLFAIVTGRINLKNRLPTLSFFKKTTPTVTPVKLNDILSNTSQNTVVTLPPPPASSNITAFPTQSISFPTPTLVKAPSYFAQQKNAPFKQQNIVPVQKIPSTGSPTLMIPLALSLLSGGIFLKRKS
jgi:hypothetical protein